MQDATPTDENDVVYIDAIKSLCDDVDEFARRSFESAPVSNADPTQLFLFVNALRAFDYYRSVQLLWSMKFSHPAAAVFRCLLEALFVSAAVHREPANLARVVKTSEYSQLRGIRNLKRLDERYRHSSITDSLLIERESASDPDAKKTSVKEWAELADCSQLYLTEYAVLSAYVHPSLSSLNEHLSCDSNGVPVTLHLKSKTEFPVRLDLRSAFAMMALLERGLTEIRDAELPRFSRINDECKRLNELMFSRKPLQ
jgi:Family of unknown function (DUF5677)